MEYGLHGRARLGWFSVTATWSNKTTDATPLYIGETPTPGFLSKLLGG